MQCEQDSDLPGLKEREHKIRVGTAGWSYKDWRGIVYPEKRPRYFDELHFMSQLFDTIEIDSTFYNIPSTSVVKHWCERVADKPDFLFSIKLWREFTHTRTELHRREVAQFKACLDVLAEHKRLGCLLIQFPWSLHFNQDNVNWMKLLLADFGNHRVTIEVRNKEWMNEQFLEFLHNSGVAFCNIDLPLISSQVAPSEIATTHQFSYVRLHGRNREQWFREGASRDERYNYLYDPDEIEPWIKRINLLKEKTKEVFVITNNHFGGKAVCNGLELKSQLENKKLDIPPQLLHQFRRLCSIASEQSLEEAKRSDLTQMDLL